MMIALASLARGGPKPPVQPDSFTLTPLPPVGSEAATTDRGAPVAAALAWLTENAPDYPPAIAPEAAARFVELVGERQPAEVIHLGSPALPVTRFESLLWQTAAARLSGPAYAAQREALASRRVRALLREAQGGEAANRADPVIARLKAESSASYRRLVDGKMEDEDLLRFASAPDERARRAEAKPVSTAPKILSAAEIVSEFARRNQAGAATAKWRAYEVEATMQTPGGGEQVLQLFKLRPNRFRVHLRATGKDAQVVAFDGTRYWRQAGPRVDTVSAEALGSLRYLAEFLDPLFDTDGHAFERREDTVYDGRPCFRLRVQRADGSYYDTLIDTENYHQLAREDSNGGRTRYADFRTVAGVTIAHREELTTRDGTVVTLSTSRLVPNPGLIAAFFETPAAQQLDLNPLEQVLAQSTSP